MAVWEALPLMCPVSPGPRDNGGSVSSLQQTSGRERSAIGPTIRGGCVITLVSGLSIPPHPQTVRDFRSGMCNTLVTPGNLSERVERWSEMCLRGFHEGQRLPYPTTDFHTPLPPHPGSSSLPLTSVPTQQSPGAHTWPAENSSKLATELRTPGARETMNLWVTLESSVQLSSEAGNQVATNGDKKSPHKDEESMACWPEHSLSFGRPIFLSHLSSFQIPLGLLGTRK